MNLSKISVRYAKAIFLLAKEKNLLEEVYKDFQLIHSSLLSSPEFRHVISSPVVKPKEKLALLENVYAKSINVITVDFLNLLVKKDREEYLIDIARNFEDLYRKEFNIKQVVVTTQTEISSAIGEKIAKIVADLYKSEVEIKNNTNDRMIGGVILRIDNQQLDLSVKTQLKEIKKQLKTTSYQKRI